MNAETGWPAVLRTDGVTLRPHTRADRVAWLATRARNSAWLAPWDGTSPAGTRAPRTYGAMLRQFRAMAREGRMLPWVVEYDGRLVGQVTVNNVVRGSAQFASVGYWIDRDYAGRGITPRAVAMAVDHCIRVAGLHRIEVAIRPENAASLRVVEKLGIPEVGYAPRYLHIDGAWRDHRLFGITAEELPPGGLVSRLPGGQTGSGDLPSPA